MAFNAEVTVPSDICSCSLLSFIWYFSLSLCCKVYPRCYSRWLISSPDTSDRSPEVTIVLGHGQIPTSVLYLSSEDSLISSFVDCPRIFSHPQIGHWAWPLLTQLVHIRSDIGPGLFQRSLNTGYNWSPQTPWPNTKNPSKIFLYQMKIEAHAMIHSTMNNVLCDENNTTSTSSDVTGLIIFFDFHFMILATAWCLV